MSVRALQLYLRVTWAYALAHTIQYTWSHRSTRELLVVDKMAFIAGGTASGPFIWPYFLRLDLIRLECLARGKPVRDYLPADDDA